MPVPGSGEGRENPDRALLMEFALLECCLTGQATLRSQQLEHPPGACGTWRQESYEVTPPWVPLSRCVDGSSGQEQRGAGWVTRHQKRSSQHCRLSPWGS